MTSVKTQRYGATQMTLHYSSALVAAGHEVSMAYELDSEASESILPAMQSAGVECFQVPRLRRSALSSSRGQLDKLISRNNVEAIISTQIGSVPATLAAAERNQIFGVVFAQNLTRFTGMPISKWLKEQVYCRSLRKSADQIVCVAPGIGTELVRRFGVSPDRIVSVLIGLDLNQIPKFSALDRQEVRAEFGLQPDDKLLISIGRIHVQKGQDVLLDAVKLLKESGLTSFKLLLVGDVESEKERQLKSQLQEFVNVNGLADHVIFTGFREDCWRLLHASDLYVLSSRWEGLPLVVLEALAAACPVLMTEYGERFDGFVDGVHGQYVPCVNPHALADGIRDYLTMPQAERLSIGLQGRAYLEEHFSLSAGKEKFVSIIEDTIAGRRECRQR